MIASFDIGEKNFAYCTANKDQIAVMKHVNIWFIKKQTVLDSCNLVSKVLEQENFSTCTQVIIEQQAQFNIRAQRIAQHVWTWFSLLKPELNPIFISPKLKTQNQKLMSYTERKKYAVNTVLQILTDQNDTKHLAYMKSLVKQDDVADAYLQLVCYLNKRKI